MIVDLEVPIGILPVEILRTMIPRSTTDKAVNSQIGVDLAALVRSWQGGPDDPYGEGGPSIHRASDALHDWATDGWFDRRGKLAKIKLSRNGHTSCKGYSLITRSLRHRCGGVGDAQTSVYLNLPGWVGRLVSEEHEITVPSMLLSAMLVGACVDGRSVRVPYTHNAARAEWRRTDTQPTFVEMSLTDRELLMLDEYRTESLHPTLDGAMANAMFMGLGLSNAIDGDNEQSTDQIDPDRLALIRVLGGCIHREDHVHRARRKQMALEHLIPFYLKSGEMRAAAHVWTQIIRDLWQDATGHQPHDERAHAWMSNIITGLKENYLNQIARSNLRPIERVVA